MLLVDYKTCKIVVSLTKKKKVYANVKQTFIILFVLTGLNAVNADLLANKLNWCESNKKDHK